MSKLRVNTFSISIDGYGAGPNQSLENPLGIGVRNVLALRVSKWSFYGKS
jgi:hypothetical protein